MRADVAARNALRSLVLLLQMSLGAGAAEASMVPPIDRADRGAVGFAAGPTQASAAIDVAVGRGLMVGLAGTYGGLDVKDLFGAMRASHRLWSGPGGSALGYMLGAGLKIDNSEISTATELELMAALVGTLVLIRDPSGPSLLVRLSYGPVFVPWLTEEFVAEPRGGLPPGMVWDPAPRPLPPVSWSFNPELVVTAPDWVELFVALRGEIGLRYRW